MTEPKFDKKTVHMRVLFASRILRELRDRKMIGDTACITFKGEIEYGEELDELGKTVTVDQLTDWILRMSDALDRRNGVNDNKLDPAVARDMALLAEHFNLIGPNSPPPPGGRRP